MFCISIINFLKCQLVLKNLMIGKKQELDMDTINIELIKNNNIFVKGKGFWITFNLFAFHMETINIRRKQLQIKLIT